MNYMKISVSILVSGIFVVLFVVLVSLTSWFLYDFYTPKTESVQPKKYQYFQYNPTKKESSFGFVSIFEDLVGDEFLSYEDKEGNLVLISNFEYQEYQCTGACFCDDSRRGGSVVSSGGRIITYLAAAMSSLIAMEKAKQYLDTKCQVEMKGKCHPNDVMFARVHGCEEPIDVEYEFEDADKAKADKKVEEEFGGNVRNFRFWCEGNCLTKDTFDGVYAEHARREYQKTFRCEEVEGSSEVLVQGITGSSHGDQMRLAELDFQNKYLKNLCVSAGTEITMRKLREEANSPNVDRNQNKVAFDRVRSHPYEDWGPCFSYTTGSDNRTIKCRPM